MDDPAINPEVHRHALQGLARLNKLSFASYPLLRALTSRLSPRPIEILDVATGSGDVALAFARAAIHCGYRCTITLTDISPLALSEAQGRFTRAGIESRVLQLDATCDPLPEADITLCSLFLHHLDERATTSLLASMAESARILAMANDLRRTVFGNILARTAPRLVTTSRVVHTDALRSARAAFTRMELADLAHKAGLGNVEIKRVPPSRMLLIWERP